MTRNMPPLAAAAVAALCFTVVGTAAAQEATPSASEFDQVTVIAPRITYEKSYRPGKGAPRNVKMAEQSAIVDVSDLDLTRIADMETLSTRVDQAAKRICAELVDLYPLGEPEIQVCIRRASDDAMAQVRQATGSSATN